jgi:hypothetical protein
MIVRNQLLTYHDGRKISCHKYEVSFRTDSLKGHRPDLRNDNGTNGSSTCRKTDTSGADIRREDLQNALAEKVTLCKDPGLKTYLSSIYPGIRPKADGVAKGEEENEDDTGIIRGSVKVVWKGLWQSTIDLQIA